MKLPVHVSAKSSSEVGYLDYISSYDGILVCEYRRYPGSYWCEDDHCWRIPQEISEYLNMRLVKMGYLLDVESRLIETPKLIETKLHPYQKDAVQKAINSQGFFFNFEMGLGKTAAAIETMKLKGYETILIICPALVRRTWEDEFKKWYPDFNGEVRIVDSGKAFKKLLHTSFFGATTIISYELAFYVLELPKDTFEVIVLDESHYIKTQGAKRSKEVRKIFIAHSKALRLGLTATPITSEPKDLWHQVDSFWPGRFGSWYKFTEAYCGRKANPWAHSGYEVVGINPARADELAIRLDEFTARVTKHDVAHLLPPFLVQTIRIGTGKQKTVDELLKERSEEGILACSDKKINEVLSYALDSLDSADHICILTHFRATAEKYKRLLLEKTKTPIYLVDGEVPIKKRLDTIDEAKRRDKSILVATLHSVNVGIDLTVFNVAILAELYWQTAAMIQALGRFSRLSGKLPSSIYIFILAASLDEPIAHVLLRRLKDQEKLFKAGQAESNLQEGLSESMSDEDFILAMREVATIRQGEEI